MTKYINANSFLKYEENRCKNFPPLIGTCSFDNATERLIKTKAIKDMVNKAVSDLMN